MPTIETYEKQGFIEISQSDFVSGISRKERQSRAVRRGKLHIGTHGGTSNFGAPTLKCPDTVYTELQIAELLGKPLLDESQQFQLLHDVYPVISKIKGFVENDGWNIDTHPSIILSDLFCQFKDKTNYEDWELEYDDKTVVRIHVVKLYGPEDSKLIPLDFLSKLHLFNKSLHDFIIYAVKLVICNNGIQDYSDCINTGTTQATEGHIYNHTEYVLENNEPEEDEYLEAINIRDYYGKKGTPVAYHKIISSAYASLRIFKKELDKLQPTDKYVEAALPFLKAAYKLASSKIDIRELSGENNDGMASPYEYMRFVWCNDIDGDMMFRLLCEFVDDMANNIGVQPFRWTEILDEDSSQQSNEMKAKCNLFIEFFEAAVTMSEYFTKEFHKRISQKNFTM